ncbi:lasso peptide biosynthesis B2 protein [Cohnella sp. GbtcB17]|uniref:lasso peptide biosynthesis B2 protein n=1 Tax=Cohnella sp. GbtcB17 TaxID=2824762 RepID=UPI0020C610E6|nr:lasso peptide biosynthesis B2 protein [Cohnella sp. GbtcB17]
MSKNYLSHMAKFLAPGRTDRLLLLEAFCYLAWARILISVPFAKVAPTLGEAMRELPETPSADKATLRRIADAIYRAAKHAPWDCRCLVRAIAALKMLKRRGIESTLYLGTGRGERGELAAHAWLRSGNFYLTGADEMKGYTPVAVFGQSARPVRKTKGWSHG